MKHLILYLCMFGVLILAGCSHTSELTLEALPGDETDVNYSVFYYIHADSGYLYHTSNGEPVRKNSKVLETAMEVGQAARTGEVFIYYQQPYRKILGLFPRNKSRLFHYRNGQLINRVDYRQLDRKENFLTTETQLWNQYRAQNLTEQHRNFLLYFGHEIPSEHGKGYHRSLPHINVNTESFGKGIQSFLHSNEERFDLIVLSTCNNGTPEMAKTLMPFTDVMLASPQNLHLSHFDTDSMSLLETNPDISSIQLGHALAEQTWQRLQTTVKTTITLALYDFNDVRSYINALGSLTVSNTASDRFLRFQDNVDCTGITIPDSESYLNGVETWYKPARFGKQSGQTTHSGWGCKPT